MRFAILADIHGNLLALEHLDSGCRDAKSAERRSTFHWVK
jgi:hypothetical protein